ncbi:uncharacterized protein [Palaemon carinicauda]|uniref:uncharacterized protein n=1 Tax=Palaemon carinicauda TaxID=392227 RepID=UPI0035B648E9
MRHSYELLITGFDEPIRYEKKLSSPIDIKTWLKQGCILSPMLFNIMMEKVARTITGRPEGIMYKKATVNSLGYADDIDTVMKDLRDTERIWLETNQEKTKVMEIARRQEMNGNINIDGMEIEVVEGFKYLGMKIVGDGNMKVEINENIGSANRCFSVLSFLILTFF